MSFYLLKIYRLLIRLYLKYLKRNISLKFTSKDSNVIDVIIPAIERDLTVLYYTVASVRKYLCHEIDIIYIVGPHSDNIIQFTIDNNCVFLDESKIFDVSVINISLKERKGWLLQQFIKLSSDNISDKKYTLVMDSDTIFCNYQRLIINGKIILNVSDEFHLPYKQVYENLMNDKYKFPISFVSHHMIIDTQALSKLKKQISLKYKKEWYNAVLDAVKIVKDEPSFFSEYETLGHYMLNNYSNNIVLEYWYNKTLDRSKLLDIKDLPKCNEYKSISLHHYI